jgi:hypothetical protein
MLPRTDFLDKERGQPDKSWLPVWSPVRTYLDQKHMILFATRRDFEKYCTEAMATCYTWKSRPGDQAIYSADEATPEPTMELEDRVSSIVASVGVNSWSSQGVTSTMVMSQMQSVGIDAVKLRHIFLSGGTVVVWRLGETLNEMEWVSLDSLTVGLGGKPDGENCMNGKLASEIFRYMHQTQVGSISYRGSLYTLMPFIKFLEMNRIYVEYEYDHEWIRVFYTYLK